MMASPPTGSDIIVKTSLDGVLHNGEALRVRH